jgi:hypothetical protein
MLRGYVGAGVDFAGCAGLDGSHGLGVNAALSEAEQGSRAGEGRVYLGLETSPGPSPSS